MNTTEQLRLSALDTLNLLDTPPDAAFDNLTRLAADVFQAPIALISLVARDRQWFKSRVGIDTSETLRSISFCHYAVGSQSMLVVEDALTDPCFAQNPIVTGDPGIRFYAGAPIHSPDGHVLGTLCILDKQRRQFDDSARRTLTLMASQVDQLIYMHSQQQALDQATRKTYATRARYEAVFKGAAAGIIRINGQGLILEINDSTQKMLGYTADELMGQNVKVLMPAHWGHAHDGYLQAYQATGKARIIGKGREVQAKHKDGTIIPVHLAVSEVHYDNYDDSQPNTREFIGILSDMRDISAIRHSEAQERALLQVLHEGLTDYHALISGNTLWRFLKEALKNLTDSQYALIGEVILSDDKPALKIHAMTDLSWDESSRQMRDRLMSGAALLSNPGTMLGRVFTRGEVVIDNSMDRNPFSDTVPKNHPVLHRFLGVPILDRGQVIGMYAIANADHDYDQDLVKWLEPFNSTCALLINLYRQLSQQQAFMRELQEARDLAERSSQAKTEFLSSMSHELRTPLNSILGFAQLLRNGKQPLSERQQRQTDQILRSGRHLLNLINEVLDLARIESGHMQVSMEPINVGDALREAIDILSPIATQHGISLVIQHLDPALPRVMADYTRLKQVLINLISNGIKYNKPSGQVTLRCTYNEQSVSIYVKDTGIGIPAEKINDLFMPFNRLGAESGSIEGTGVGLALTRKLVELMQGRIGVTSQQDQGSEFWFELALAPSVIATHADGQTLLATQHGKPLWRVLYIEDNPANQRLLHDFFDELGDIQLQCVHSAEVGIELACSDPPALILMDIDLPGICGFQAQQMLANNPLTRSIPVVAVSAGKTAHRITDEQLTRFAGYITKPFDLPVLAERVLSLLKNTLSAS